jgi:hypothetical protein
MFGTITKHEIDATQAAIMVPLVLFANFRDFCSSMTQNYEFLTACGHNIPELTRIDNFLASIQAWPKFDPYVWWCWCEVEDSGLLGSITLD